MELIAKKKKRRWPIYVLLSVVGFIVLSVALSSPEAIKKQGEKYVDDIKKESVKEIEIVDYNETVTEYMRTVHVTVRNNSQKLATMISVKVIYKDNSGKVVGTAPGVVMNVPAGESKVVDCNGMSIDNAASYTVQLEVANFD